MLLRSLPNVVVERPLAVPRPPVALAGTLAASRLPAALVEPLFTDGWAAAPSETILSALLAAAPNTRQAWAADWEVYRAWALGPAARHWPDPRERLTLPIPPEQLARFVVEQRDGSGTADGQPRTLNTIRRYLSTLATLHRLLELPDPTQKPLVRNTLKAEARGSGGPDQAAALRWAHLAALFAALPDDLAGCRDRALLAVGHNTLARRAELVALDISDLNWLADGSATVALRPTKTDLEARIDVRYLTPPGAALVRAWLDRSGLRSGPLFVRLQRNGEARVSNGQRGAGRALSETGQRLTPSAVNVIVKAAVARLADASVLPDEAAVGARPWSVPVADAYSGHSLRVGAAQDLAAAGIGTPAILQAGGWKDVRMIQRYLRELSALEGGMAQWYAKQGL